MGAYPPRPAQPVSRTLALCARRAGRAGLIDYRPSSPLPAALNNPTHLGHVLLQRPPKHTNTHACAHTRARPHTHQSPNAPHSHPPWSCTPAGSPPPPDRPSRPPCRIGEAAAARGLVAARRSRDAHGRGSSQHPWQRTKRNAERMQVAMHHRAASREGAISAFAGCYCQAWWVGFPTAGWPTCANGARSRSRVVCNTLGSGRP